MEHLSYSLQHPCVVDRLPSQAQDTHNPMHAAAISHLTSDEVQWDLVRYFQPQPEERKVGRNGTHRETNYEGGEQNAAPQPQFVIEVGEVTNPMGSEFETFWPEQWLKNGKGQG